MHNRVLEDAHAWGPVRATDVAICTIAAASAPSLLLSPQEDTRRRGTLPLQGHGVIFCDNTKVAVPSGAASNAGAVSSASGTPSAVSSPVAPAQPSAFKVGNSLQLVTQGHPSLLLNYCK